MTLIQLRYLLAIVDAKLNISAAAVAVHATQSGISKQLKQLEDELSFQVFLRRGKALDRISERGAEVIARARTILAEVENIHATATGRREETRRQLRIATTSTQGRFVLPVALRRLNRRFPQLATHLTLAARAEALEMLESDRADLAIVSTGGERPQGDLVLPLYRWNRVLITRRDHPLAARAAPLTLADLAAVPLVTYASALHPRSWLATAFRAQRLEPNLACTCPDADTIKTYVRSGLGAGLVSEMTLQPADDDLARMPVDDLFPPGTTWMVIRRDRVQRDYLLELLLVLAPGLQREQIRTLLQGKEAPELTYPLPAWATVHARAQEGAHSP